jgi:hypothetical protein
LHEIEVVTLGVLDPEHIIEQKIVAVARCQPLMRDAG